MSDTIRRRDDCRLCGSTDLDLALELVPTPPANAFVAAAERESPQECFPLEVYLCKGCGHLQLLHVVDPAVLFRNYVYVSGTSPSFVEHFRKYAGDVTERYATSRSGVVVDIGSNDGTLLGFFAELGFEVLGVDPAVKIAEQATARPPISSPIMARPRS